MASHQICHSLLVRSMSPGQPTLKGRGLHVTLEARTIGAILQSVHHRLITPLLCHKKNSWEIDKQASRSHIQRLWDLTVSSKVLCSFSLFAYCLFLFCLWCLKELVNKEGLIFWARVDIYLDNLQRTTRKKEPSWQLWFLDSPHDSSGFWDESQCSKSPLIIIW